MGSGLGQRSSRKLVYIGDEIINLRRRRGVVGDAKVDVPQVLEGGGEVSEYHVAQRHDGDEDESLTGDGVHVPVVAGGGDVARDGHRLGRLLGRDRAGVVQAARGEVVDGALLVICCDHGRAVLDLCVGGEGSDVIGGVRDDAHGLLQDVDEVHGKVEEVVLLDLGQGGAVDGLDGVEVVVDREGLVGRGRGARGACGLGEVLRRGRRLPLGDGFVCCGSGECQQAEGECLEGRCAHDDDGVSTR